MATHSKNAYFGVDDSGDTLRDLSAYLTSGGVDQSVDTDETSTWGDDSKEYIEGLADGTINIEGPWDSTVDGYLHGIKQEGEKDFEYGPAGDTATYVKYSGKCVLTAYNISGGDGAVKFTATFQISGDVTRGTFS